MSNGTLIRFLEIGLINVGGDDAKLEKLNAASQDLTATLKEMPGKTTAYTLAAADPYVAPNDPVIEEGLAALRNRWTTMANTFSTTPVSVVRAVLLDALVRAAEQNPAIAVAFVNSARNALPYVESGDEGTIWAGLVASIEKQVDARAEVEWATPDMISVEPMDYNPPEAITVAVAGAVTVNRDVLNERILRATGPYSGGDQNPHWPNSPQPWGTEFAKRLTLAIADIIDSVAGRNAGASIDVAGPFSELADAVSEHVAKVLQSISGATAGLQRRTRLLWWKEAMYSPSAGMSYRSMPPFVAALLMACDLHNQVPVYSPASVAAFLDEAVHLLPDLDEASNRDRSVLELVQEVRSTVALGPLRDLAGSLFPAPVGRGPVLGLVGHVSVSGLDAAEFKRLTGLSEEVRLSAPTWAAWLFREIQAARAIKAIGVKQ